MSKRLEALLMELGAATALTIMSMTPREREYYLAVAMRGSAKIARRLAEGCLRYAIRAENVSTRMVSP